MRSGFFNSTITGYDEQGQPIFDRAEDASFFAKYFSQFVGNGVFALPADGLMVQAEEGMAVTVKAGTCFINGYMGWLEQDQQLSVAASSETFARIDRVVVRYDAVQRGIDLFILQGTPAASPVPPSITQHAQGDIYELALADIMVNRNASALRQADITDLRLNEAVCGVVASPVEHLETGAANAQLTDAFNQWFEGIKGQLSEDAAGNLQNQIDAHTGDTDVHITTAERAQWNKGIEKDFIVEQGVSGMWTYRKWNSGIAECWGSFPQTVLVTSVWDSGNVMKFGLGQAVSFPFAFASVPNCTMSLLDYPNFFLLSHQGEVTQTKTFTPAIVSVNRYESVDCLFGFYVIGKV